MKIIASLLVFYPLIIPIWQEEPLTYQNTKKPEKRSFLNENEVRWQAEQFKKIKDPRIKSKMVFDLLKSNNPETVKQLLPLVKGSSEKLQADILLTLYNMRHISKSGLDPVLSELFKVDNEQIKAYSSALYLNNGGNPNEILKLLDKDSSPFFLNYIENELIEKAESCDNILLEKHLKTNNPRLSSLAISIIVSKKTDPDQSSILNDFTDSEYVSIRTALSKSLSERNSGGIRLLTKLSKDKSATVRGYVGESKPSQDRLPLFLDLTNDLDYEVRRTAALSLGNFNTPDSINTLIKLFSDKTPEVRNAAEISIIKINPDKDFMKKIGENSLNKKSSLPSAIRVLGALKDKRYSEAINNYLASTQDDDIILRSIEALEHLDDKDAAKNISSRADHNSKKIQQAVAHALGTLAVKDSFDTLMNLSKASGYPNKHVKCEAIKSMGRIGSSYFNKRLNEILNDVNGPAECRAAACWSIARIKNPMNESIKQLKKTILERIIPSIGAPPAYDVDYSRISALLAIIEMGEKQPELKTKAIKATEILRSDKEDKYGEPISGPSLKEFARQANLYLNGTENIPPAPLSTSTVSLTVKKYKK